MRYRLYLRRLKYAALRGVGTYNPHAVVTKLTHRLFDKYTDEGDSCASNQHIVEMNTIGKEIENLHETWMRMNNSGYHKGTNHVKSHVCLPQLSAARQRSNLH